MAVNYVRVNPVVDLFSPVIRATGNLAIIGAASTGTADTPVQVTSPSNAEAVFGGPSGSALTRAAQVAFRQTPGPSQIWGVPTGADPATALTAVETLDVQFVMVANTVLDATTGGANGTITKLVNHVIGVSNTGGDGKERMGVVMLPKGSTSTALVTGTLADDRMIYIAHKSVEDAAAAVAGTVAGYAPHISVLLKQVSITSDPFTAAEIDAINGSETFKSGPAGKGVNWLVDPALIAGAGVYLGEGYTGNPGGKKYVDVQRTVDDVSFRLKARLIRSIGALRISRSGLRSLVVQMEAILDPLVADAVIEGYEITIPVLNLLDADPASLTASQLQQINDAQTNRVIEVLIAVDYAGAMHRIAITLKFE